MADPIRRLEHHHDDARSGGDAAGTRPRWVYVLGILIAVALVGLIVLLHLSGTIGPGTH